MNSISVLYKDAMDMLKATSRTFFIPIDRLPKELKEAVASAYLCMRAIDEIEDHPELPSTIKVKLLQSISHLLQKPWNHDEFIKLIHPHRSYLPEVTIRMGDWFQLCPVTIQPSIASATAEMADGMAQWVSRKWNIRTKEDLDHYTYIVAGLVGVMLTEIWKWYDGTQTDRELAIGFGRGLQAVNILRNRDEDLSRGVDFFPDGWTKEEMFAYAKHNLSLADAYIKEIQSRPILEFCKIPLTLAYGTIDVLLAGKSKLSRTDVAKLVIKALGK